MNDTLLAQARAFVDRKYVVTADERQKSLGLGYITAEQIAALEAQLADAEKRITALRAAYRLGDAS